MSGQVTERKRWRFLAVQLVTFARVPLVTAFAIILLNAQHTTATLFLCGVLLGLAELTDMLDGILARRLGTVTEWGAMLDPYMDSISRLIVYWTLACARPPLVVAFAPLAMALRDITVAYSRITLARYGKSVSAKLSGKIKAEVQGGAAVLLVLGPLYWKYTGTWTLQVLSWTVIVVTLLSTIEYVAAAASTVLKKDTQSGE
jgi:CDP-diacylglycerol--glycerol-3-phosphate 3-phosphatidyltransferase